MCFDLVHILCVLFALVLHNSFWKFAFKRILLDLTMPEKERRRFIAILSAVIKLSFDCFDKITNLKQQTTTTSRHWRCHIDVALYRFWDQSKTKLKNERNSDNPIRPKVLALNLSWQYFSFENEQKKHRRKQEKKTE